jgi:hypothetical protein
MYSGRNEKSSDELIKCSFRRYSTGRRRSHCFRRNGTILESSCTQPVDDNECSTGEDNMVEGNTKNEVHVINEFERISIFILTSYGRNQCENCCGFPPV